MHAQVLSLCVRGEVYSSKNSMAHPEPSLTRSNAGKSANAQIAAVCRRDLDQAYEKASPSHRAVAKAMLDEAAKIEG